MPLENWKRTPSTHFLCVTHVEGVVEGTTQKPPTYIFILFQRYQPVVSIDCVSELSLVASTIDSYK